MSKACYRHIHRMHGLNTYDYGARQYDPILGRWDRIDPLAEKYYSTSPYVYCVNNPVMLVDPDGRDGVKIIDTDNKTITVKANYYVRTSDSQYKDSDGNLKTLSGYSSKDIENMNGYNDYLNGLKLTVPSGEYEGYAINFELSFIDAGATEILSAANDFDEDGNHIGNSISKGNSNMYRNINFDRKDLDDGSTSVVAGVTAENTNIIMNVGYYGNDTKMNRLHEIFHTLGQSHPKGSSSSDGIMNYPPKTPSKNDALFIANTTF